TGTPVMTNRSFEFQGGTTVYPAGSYLVLLPGLLLGLAPPLVIQSGIAAIDGVSVLATAVLARKLGGSQRAALLSAGVHGMLLISGAIGGLLVYGPAVAMHLAQLRRVGTQVLAQQATPVYSLIARALWIAYTPIGGLLVVPGLGLLGPRLRGVERVLLGGWV